VQKLMEPYFNRIDAPVVIDQKRGGKSVRYFYVYRLRNAKPNATAVLPVINHH